METGLAGWSCRWGIGAGRARIRAGWNFRERQRMILVRNCRRQYDAFFQACVATGDEAEKCLAIVQSWTAAQFKERISRRFGLQKCHSDRISEIAPLSRESEIALLRRPAAVDWDRSTGDVM
jgi:hypothetical protein